MILILIKLMLVDWRRGDQDYVGVFWSRLLEGGMLGDQPESVNVRLKVNMLWGAGHACIVGAKENGDQLDRRPGTAVSTKWQVLLKSSQTHGGRETRKTTIDNIEATDVLSLEVGLKRKGTELRYAIAHEKAVAIRSASG